MNSFFVSVSLLKYNDTKKLYKIIITCHKNIKFFTKIPSETFPDENEMSIYQQPICTGRKCDCVSEGISGALCITSTFREIRHLI